MNISHTLAPRLSPYFCFFTGYLRGGHVKSNISILFKDDVFKGVGKIILIPSETTHVVRSSLYFSRILVVEKIKGKNNSYEHFRFFFFFTLTCFWSNDQSKMYVIGPRPKKATKGVARIFIMGGNIKLKTQF